MSDPIKANNAYIKGDDGGWVPLLKYGDTGGDISEWKNNAHVLTGPVTTTITGTTHNDEVPAWLTLLFPELTTISQRLKVESRRREEHFRKVAK